MQSSLCGGMLPVITVHSSAPQLESAEPQSDRSPFIRARHENAGHIQEADPLTYTGLKFAI